MFIIKINMLLSLLVLLMLLLLYHNNHVGRPAGPGEPPRHSPPRSPWRSQS